MEELSNILKLMCRVSGLIFFFGAVVRMIIAVFLKRKRKTMIISAIILVAIGLFVTLFGATIVQYMMFA